MATLVAMITCTSLLANSGSSAWRVCELGLGIPGRKRAEVSLRGAVRGFLEELMACPGPLTRGWTGGRPRGSGGGGSPGMGGGTNFLVLGSNCYTM